MNNPPVSKYVHSSMPLYVLFEESINPQYANYAEIACIRHEGVEGICVYVSLIDAAIDRHDWNKGGRKYEIRLLQSIDIDFFIRQHEGWLIMNLSYGFAAAQNKVWMTSKNVPLPLAHKIYFQPDPAESVIELADDWSGWLAQLYRGAGVYEFPVGHLSLGHTNNDELDGYVKEALSRMPQTQAGGKEIPQCAVYDSLERRWGFVECDTLFSGIGAM